MNIVKESLAKLLAQEDLIIEHRPVQTAQFDVTRRILTLPTWSHENNYVTDLLIAHEVSHALYTPDDDSWLDEVNMSFVNVVEDIRVEKLIKRRYQGLPKTFFNGYEVLQEEDFFDIESKDLTQLNLADKLNLHFKVGHHVDIPFTTEELYFKAKADLLETFEDTISLAKELHAYCKDQLDKQRQNQESSEQDSEKGEEVQGDSTPSDEKGDSSDGQQQQQQQQSTQEPEIEEVLQETQEKAPEGTNAGRGNGPEDAQISEPQIETADSFDEAIKGLVEKTNRENYYIELPSTLKSNHIVDNKETDNYLTEFYANQDALRYKKDFADSYDHEVALNTVKDLDKSDADYRNFKVGNTKEVNYLVKEFEMKKAADGYARATTSRTGVLDTSKLHQYKYNEDLFKKVTTIPNSKNHGLIFNVDWSGSMHHQILATIKQTLTMVSFCRKVGIAYDVYLFTDAWEKESYSYEEDASLENKAILKNFNLINVLTSTSNNRLHEKQALNLFRLANAYNGHYGYGNVPHKLHLGGTPLNEAMIALNYIIPQFKKNTGVQKVHVLTLTDGEGAPSVSFGKKAQRYYDEAETKIYSSRIDSNVFLRDRKTGKMYKFDDCYWGSGMTETFVTQLRDRFPECEFMNIRLITGNDWGRFKSSCLGSNVSQEEISRADAVWRRTKSFICTSSFWTIQYALHINALDNKAEFEVAEEATKAQIKKAFSKSLGNKKMNKKILSSFIERIA